MPFALIVSCVQHQLVDNLQRRINIQSLSLRLKLSNLSSNLSQSASYKINAGTKSNKVLLSSRNNVQMGHIVMLLNGPNNRFNFVHSICFITTS